MMQIRFEPRLVGFESNSNRATYLGSNTGFAPNLLENSTQFKSRTSNPFRLLTLSYVHTKRSFVLSQLIHKKNANEHLPCLL